MLLWLHDTEHQRAGFILQSHSRNDSISRELSAIWSIIQHSQGQQHMSLRYKGYTLFNPTGCDGWYDDVIKWKHFPRNWSFVRWLHRSPANSPHKGQWRGALIFSLICVWINVWVNNREACDLRRYRPHYDDIEMVTRDKPWQPLVSLNEGRT